MWMLRRAVRLLLHPASEWRSIAVQPTTTTELYRYALVMAAIQPIAAFIGYSVIGVSLGIVSRPLRMPIEWGLSRAIFGYVLWLVGVYVTALIVTELAPKFQGRAEFIDGLKIAVYAPTAFWLAGIFMLVPSAGAILSLLGLYGVYTLAVGLPIVIRSPPDESIWYVTAIVFCYIAIVALIALFSLEILPGLGA